MLSFPSYSWDIWVNPHRGLLFGQGLCDLLGDLVLKRPCVIYAQKFQASEVVGDHCDCPYM